MELDTRMCAGNGTDAMQEEVDKEADGEAEAANAVANVFAHRAARRAERQPPTPCVRTHGVHIVRVPRSLEEPYRKKFVPETLFLGLFSELDSNYHSDSTTQFKIEVVDEFIDFINSRPQLRRDDRWDWEKLKKYVVGDNEKKRAWEYYDIDKAHRKSAEVERHVLALDSIFLCCYLCAYFPVLREHYPRGIVSRRSVSFHQRLMTDIVKLQNQIPLFLMSRVLEIISAKPDHTLTLNHICKSWILHHYASLPGITKSWISHHSATFSGITSRPHLLECLCHVLDRDFVPDSGKSDGQTNPFRHTKNPQSSRRKKALYRKSPITGRVRTLITGSHRFHGTFNEEEDHAEEISLPSATELRRGGVHFRGHGVKKGDTKKLVPKFSRGFLNISATVHIPAFSVLPNTEVVWTNMIAYIHEGRTLESATMETAGQESEPILTKSAGNGAADFINFLMFMDEMVDNEQDVALLRFGKHRVIQKNMLGTNQEVADLLNKIVQEQPAESINYGADWQDLRSEINAFYTERERIVFLEFLRTNFGKPWLVISIVIGSFVLLSTFLQTYYTVLSYYTN